MSELVYAFCAVTSMLCAILLTRGYRRTKQPLLLWSCACFIGLALSNILLVVDLALTVGGPDLSFLRHATALISLSFLLYGLIWEVR